MEEGVVNTNTLKKNCNRCVAGKHFRCELGYDSVWKSFDTHGFTLFGTPQEKCPKPLNNSDFIFATHWYKKKGEK